VFHHAGTFYAFYATRMPNWTQHLCVATSADGVHFVKSRGGKPFASPAPGYDPQHYRDPCVFRDERSGLFHMLVTASLEEYPLKGRGGCLAHLVSSDLKHWDRVDPFLIPGFLDVPECPDHFEWNGWRYLVFSTGGVAHYRMSRDPLGPWACPRVDVFDGPMARVLKTAAFGGNRRIGVAFLPSLQDDNDHGAWLYAGNAVFREIIQHEDGTLGTRFPPEMIPPGRAVLDMPFTALTSRGFEPRGRLSGAGAEGIRITALAGLGVGMLEGVPRNARVSARIRPWEGETPTEPPAAYGLCVRAAGAYESGYEVRLCPHEQRVEIRPLGARTAPRPAIAGVRGLDAAVALDIVLKDDIIDVCVNERRCLVSRFPGLRGERLFLFCENGDVVFESVEVRPL
jgi:hypothetical protein